jgi:hypothetical protein
MLCLRVKYNRIALLLRECVPIHYQFYFTSPLNVFILFICLVYIPLSHLSEHYFFHFVIFPFIISKPHIFLLIHWKGNILFYFLHDSVRIMPFNSKFDSAEFLFFLKEV